MTKTKKVIQELELKNTLPLIKMLLLLSNKLHIILLVILLVACKESKQKTVAHSIEKCGFYKPIAGVVIIDGKESEFLATETYFRIDSFLLSDIAYAKEGYPIKETLYSNVVADSLGYGLAIFYDTIPNRIKHVEIIAIRKSIAGSKRHRIFSQRYLKEINPQAYKLWINKLKDDGFNYPIDTYH